MAQAARLNLRMQKELKLLLTDPPPGASFPSLSADSSASSSAGPSLSSIEAQIEGPEGTVYANGFFRLRIQIPDRYPFQPPIVTFATPLYHPNIDNGGRICLDILNLPPKGAWQPSLNISTVLTSIGLLLSEPNPDDGLMHEASQEYKYSRQVFDQKARSMTEKYARVGACEIAVGGQDCETPSLNFTESKGSDTSMPEVDHCLIGSKRFCGISRKLSLESAGLDQEGIHGKTINAVPSEHLSGREREHKGLKQESNEMPNMLIQSQQEPQKMSKKLSLEPLLSLNVKRDSDINDLVSTKGKSISRTDCSESLPLVQSGFSFQPKRNQCDERSTWGSASTNLEKEELLQPVDSKIGKMDDQEKLHSVDQQPSTECPSSGLHNKFSLSHANSHQKREPHSASVNGAGVGPARIRHKKLGLAGRHFSSGMLLSHQCQGKADTRNLAPISSFRPGYTSKNPTPSLVVSEDVHCQDRSTLNCSSTCLESRLPLKPLSQSNNGNTVHTQSEMESLNSSKVSTAQHHNCFDEKLQANQDCEEKFAAGIKKQEAMTSSTDTEEVIVLDSEDSDDDQRATTRSKLSLARRRFPGKVKS